MFGLKKKLKEEGKKGNEIGRICKDYLDFDDGDKDE